MADDDDDDNWFPAEIVHDFDVDIQPVAVAVARTMMVATDKDKQDKSATGGERPRIRLVVVQDFIDARTGGIVWLSALLTARFVGRYDLRRFYPFGRQQQQDFSTMASSPAVLEKLAGACVMEIGAGCGLIGLLAWRLGARLVVLTDTSDVIPHMRANVERNSRDEAEEEGVPALKRDVERIVCTELAWGVRADEQRVQALCAAPSSSSSSLSEQAVEPSSPAFDAIFVSNCMYGPEPAMLMLETVSRLCHPGRTAVYLCGMFEKAVYDGVRVDPETGAVSFPGDDAALAVAVGEAKLSADARTTCDCGTSSASSSLPSSVVAGDDETPSLVRAFESMLALFIDVCPRLGFTGYLVCTDDIGMHDPNMPPDKQQKQAATTAPPHDKTTRATGSSAPRPLASYASSAFAASPASVRELCQRTGRPPSDFTKGVWLLCKHTPIEQQRDSSGVDRGLLALPALDGARMFWP